MKICYLYNIIINGSKVNMFLNYFFKELFFFFFELIYYNYSSYRSLIFKIKWIK